MFTEVEKQAHQRNANKVLQ